MVKGKKKSSLGKRYQSSYDTKEKGNGGRKGVMDWKKVEGEVEFYSPVEGKNRINIIPYSIKTKNHPLVKKGEMEIGDKDYVMDVFTHRGVGPSEATVLCLKQTYGKPCPICEQANQLKKAGKEKEAGELKPSRRVFYNVEDCKNPGEIKVFEASHYLFEKELIDEARDDEEGGFIDFADEEEGKEIKFRCSKTTKGNISFNEFKSFSFEDRDEPLSDELIESAISFDEILNIPTYEEAEKILFGDDDDEDSEEEKSSKKRSVDDDDEDGEPEEKKKPVKKSKKVEPDEDDEDEDDEEPEEKPSKKSSKKRVEEDDEEPEPPKKKPAKKSESDDDESEEEQDEDEEDEKPSKKSCDKNCGKCPFGHKFGKDVDKFPDDCDECDVWDKCIKG